MHLADRSHAITRPITDGRLALTHRYRPAGALHGHRLDGEDSESLAGLLLGHYGASLQRRLTSKYSGTLRPGELEDVVMIAIEHAWMHWEQFDRSKGTLDAWLWRIADHASTDMVRRRWCQTRLCESDRDPVCMDELAAFNDFDGQTPADSATPESEEITALWAALDQLSDKQRFIVLADNGAPDETAPAKTLAAELGTTASAMRSARQRTWARLRRELSPARPEKPPQKQKKERMPEPPAEHPR